MIYNGNKLFSDNIKFFVDSMYFGEYLIETQPNITNYNSEMDYLNDFSEWIEAVKEGYLSIDHCPSSAQNEWKQFGEALDLNENILAKEAMAITYKDDLRMISAINMSSRFYTVLGSRYDKLANCFGGEIDHCTELIDAADNLAEEIHAYAEMEQGERNTYEFKNINPGDINPEYDVIDTIYPSLYNTYDAFLIIRTGCISGTRQIVVEAEIPGFTQKYKESISLDPSYKAIYIKPPALAGDLDLSSAKDAQINVTISDLDGTLIDTKTFSITIKSKYDFEWYSDEYGTVTQDNILCFLTPESSAISDLKRLAIEEMSSMTGGRVESFAGYQNPTEWTNSVCTYLQAAGIMRALYDMGVRYNMDTFSISGSNQHILLPEDVLNQKSGLCIETSLVVASALQSAGMHAFLVFPPGHAQVAVETWEGSGQYFLIETTALSGSNNNAQIYVDVANQLINENTMPMPSSGYPITYMNGEEWIEYLSGEGTYLIDCDDSRVLGLTPFAN